MKTSGNTQKDPTRELIVQSATVWQVVGVICLAGYLLMQWQAYAKSAIYGGLVAVIANIWLLWRMRGAANKSPADAQGSLQYLQRTAMVRFALVGGMLAIPLMSLSKWHYAAVIMGFAAGQLLGLFGLIVSSKKIDKRSKKID